MQATTAAAAVHISVTALESQMINGNEKEQNHGIGRGDGGSDELSTHSSQPQLDIQWLISITFYSVSASNLIM